MHVHTRPEAITATFPTSANSSQRRPCDLYTSTSAPPAFSSPSPSPSSSKQIQQPKRKPQPQPQPNTPIYTPAKRRQQAAHHSAKRYKYYDTVADGEERGVTLQRLQSRLQQRMLAVRPLSSVSERVLPPQPLLLPSITVALPLVNDSDNNDNSYIGVMNSGVFDDGLEMNGKMDFTSFLSSSSSSDFSTLLADTSPNNTLLPSNAGPCDNLAVGNMAFWDNTTYDTEGPSTFLPDTSSDNTFEPFNTGLCDNLADGNMGLGNNTAHDTAGSLTLDIPILSADPSSDNALVLLNTGLCDNSMHGDMGLGNNIAYDTAGSSALDTSALDTSALDTSALDTSALDTSTLDISTLNTSAIHTSNSDTSADSIPESLYNELFQMLAEDQLAKA
ncbi:hypothetical protein EAF00_012051 [Botryotinia globosa]|nr:hypothetical protein EAF00_012051 [Botryotinia globosa]